MISIDLRYLGRVKNYPAFLEGLVRFWLIATVDA
jgi:hypothetical protein